MGTFVFLETTSPSSVLALALAVRLWNSFWWECLGFPGRERDIFYGRLGRTCMYEYVFVIWNSHYDIPRSVLLLAADGLHIRSLRFRLMLFRNYEYSVQ